MASHDLDDGFDPAGYGEAFADVYDEWYRDLGDPAAVVAALERLVGRAGTVVELGVGTGRLAIPLATAGWRVVGMDASPSMLERLSARLADAGLEVRAVPGDVADPATWLLLRDQIDHPSPFSGTRSTTFPPRTVDPVPENEGVDVVLASFNLLLNLPDGDAQARTVGLAAEALRPGGLLVCEAQVLDLDGAPTESVAERPDGVRIHTTIDAAAGIVRGRHVDASGVERPWRLCALSPDRLDALAADAGLELQARWSTWDGEPFVADESPTAISVHRRPLSPAVEPG